MYANLEGFCQIDCLCARRDTMMHTVDMHHFGVPAICDFNVEGRSADWIFQSPSDMWSNFPTVGTDSQIVSLTHRVPGDAF